MLRVHNNQGKIELQKLNCSLHFFSKKAFFTDVLQTIKHARIIEKYLKFILFVYFNFILVVSAIYAR